MSTQPTSGAGASGAESAQVAALLQEMGVDQVEPAVVIVAGRRWLLRPLGLDDQIWAQGQAGRVEHAGSDLLFQAATVAIGVAGIGQLKTVEVTEKVKVAQEDGSEVEEERVKAVPAADDEQPEIVPLIDIFPKPVAAFAPPDPFNPSNPWREAAAAQLLERMRQRKIGPGIIRDLFLHLTDLQSRTEVPALPLPQRSPRATTT